MSRITEILVSNINRILEEKDIKQTWLAGRVGKHQSQLSRYLSGKDPLPNELAEVIAKVPELETTIEALLGAEIKERKESKEELQAQCISLIFELDVDYLPVVRNFLVGTVEQGAQFCPEAFKKNRA
jgi:transcriptional regulator with XRE-family HTH domain